MIERVAYRSRRSDRPLRQDTGGPYAAHLVELHSQSHPQRRDYLSRQSAESNPARIYDKRLESQAKQRENWHDYGIRWELELKKDRAQVCGQVLSYLEETDWLEFKVGVLRGYVDFRDTARD